MSAVVGNATIVNSFAAGHLTASAAGLAVPDTSSLNAYYPGQTVANHQMVPVTSRGLSLYSRSGSHMVFDTTGYIVGHTRPAAGGQPHQTAPEPLWPLHLSIPRIGVEVPIGGDTSAGVVDQGWAGWTPNTSYPGMDGAMLLFGHRTTHGAPFHDLHLLQAGDEVRVEGDRRLAVYRVSRREVLTEAQAVSLISKSGSAPDSVQLLACSQPDGSPTNTAYRIVVTCDLVSYVNP